MNLTSSGGISGGKPSKRRILVVADPGRESAGALQWALNHAVLENDELILLHVEQLAALRAKPTTAHSAFAAYFIKRNAARGEGSSRSGAVAAALGTSSSMGDSNEGDFLEAMRAKCELLQPKVKVQIERVEMDGKDKAAAILAQCNILSVDLLVIGQQRRSSFILSKLTGNTMNRDTTAEFLIKHSKCLCVGVQKKGQNAGYLLNTMNHKNFWLLA